MVSFGLCCWNFFRGLRSDPGFIPFPTDDTEIKIVRARFTGVDAMLSTLCRYLKS